MGKQTRFSLLGILVVFALLFTGCYPFQGDVTLLLTPVPPGQAQVAAPTSAPAEEAAAPADEGTQPAPALTVTVNVDSLRVRQGPSTETPIVAGLRGGTAVTALGRTEDASWLQIQVPDVETQGWVAAEFVTPDGDIMALPVVGEGAVAEAPTAAPAEEPAAAEPTPAPVEEPAPVEPVAGDAANSVIVADQTVDAGMVTVAQVNAAQDGWIVIHADDAGTFGEVIGYAQVAAGANENVVVEIDAARATPILYAMLHVDAGEPGVYEFPGPDGPVIVDGAPVSPTFQVEMAAAEQPAPAEEPA
ncbi:MAG: SH3 domain-containing protein, partial [Caldilineae bacterium]